MSDSDVDITLTSRMSRTRLVMWGAILAIAALLITGMFIWADSQDAARTQAEHEAKVEAERLEQIRLAAVEDAQALTEAANNALAASDTFHADVQLALIYLESTAIPVRDVIADASEEFGEDHHGELSTAIEALSGSLAPPVLSPQGTDTAVVAHADASPALAGHVEDVDRTIQHALVAAGDVGVTTQGDVEDASDEALEELQAAIDALGALTEVEVVTEWASRTADQPSALVGVVDVVNDYLSATEAARGSHEGNRAPEPYICYAYRWGGPHPTYCWR